MSPKRFVTQMPVHVFLILLRVQEVVLGGREAE